MSQKSATVADFGDCRRVVSPFSATVALFCDSVDRALDTLNSKLAAQAYAKKRCLSSCLSAVDAMDTSSYSVDVEIWRVFLSAYQNLEQREL